MVSNRPRSIHFYLDNAKKKLQNPWRPLRWKNSDPERERQEAEAQEKRERQEDYWRLHGAVKDLHQAVVVGYEQLETSLRRRGHLPIQRDNLDSILVPFEAGHGNLEPNQQQYLDSFGKASFRKFARKLIAACGQSVPTEQLQEICGAKADGYAALLQRLGVAEHLPDGVRLTRQIDNIGPTLEWYVAQLCQRELFGSAEWSVKLEGLRTGGDYDVLAWLDPLLMYVETKSSALTGVDESQLRNFLQRTVELAPDLAVLLIDTSDDLADLLGRLDEIISPITLRASTIPIMTTYYEQLLVRPQADYPGVSFGYRRIYVTNSEPSILTQLRRCLQHYHVHVKGVPLVPGPPVNFVADRIGKGS